jgi:hypothetical protein
MVAEEFAFFTAQQTSSARKQILEAGYYNT